jgi:hypothetical protein
LGGVLGAAAAVGGGVGAVGVSDDEQPVARRRVGPNMRLTQTIDFLFPDRVRLVFMVPDFSSRERNQPRWGRLVSDGPLPPWLPTGRQEAMLACERADGSTVKERNESDF